MSAKEPTMWVVRGGAAGQYDTLFLQRDLVAIGWEEMGDLSKIPPTTDDFRSRVASCYPDRKPGAVPNNAGQLFRFTHVMKQGDMVLYPSRVDRKVHIGRITGPYRYDPGLSREAPNLRPVEWLRSVPRTHFTQGALYEIGSALTVFQVRNYADEFRRAMDGKAKPPSDDKDETVGLVAVDIEETTRDFILKRLAQELKGHPFAGFVAHLLGTMGYRTRVSPEGPDGGVDIVAHRDELGFEPPIIKVQVKSGDDSISNSLVASLNGTVAHGEYGMFVTLGTFTPPARNFAKGRSNLRLIDGAELVSLVLQHYEQFDSRYKGLIPLKQVYVPQDLPELEQA